MKEWDSIAAETDAVELRIDEHAVGWITIDRPGSRMNILSSGVMRRLDDLLGTIEAEATAGRIRSVVIRSGKPGSFIAGADIGEIASITDPADGTVKAAAGQRVFTRLAALPVPTVAAVDGVCLGGGTELILACSYRIGTDRKETRIGLPEIQLGIIPGFGGTTRLPRLVGMQSALEMILTGKPVDARKAERIGLVNERLHPAILDERAGAVARELQSRRRDPSRKTGPLTKRLLEGTVPGRQLMFRQARKNVLKETRGHYPAPLAALDLLEETLSLSVAQSLAREAELIGKLVVTPVSKNLIHVFHLNEAAKKSAPDVTPGPTDRVAVLGAGVMGGGIAQLLSYRGVQVRLKDIKPEAVALGLRHAREQFDSLVKRRRLQKREAKQMMERIAPTLDYSGFGVVDLVIEAVIEKMEVKKSVLAETERVVRPGTVLTTNTSSLSVTEMQGALARPGDLAGMHFFNPVNRMPLVEIIRGEETSDETIATVFSLARRLEKTPVIVRDGPGFLVNRILAPYLNEAGWLLADGLKIEDIDKALLDFGMPMGPLRLLDEVGLDVSRHAGSVMYEAFGDRLKPAPPLTAPVNTKRLGRKSGLGFYTYEKGKHKAPDPTVFTELGLRTPHRTLLPELIVERSVYVMVNEAARILEDGIVARPGDVDLGMIMGTGFPPFRGGLLRYADTIGTGRIVQRLVEFEREHGARFTPAPLLRRLAAENRGFYD